MLYIGFVAGMLLGGILAIITGSDAVMVISLGLVSGFIGAVVGDTYERIVGVFTP